MLVPPTVMCQRFLYILVASLVALPVAVHVMPSSQGGNAPTEPSDASPTLAWQEQVCFQRLLLEKLDPSEGFTALSEALRELPATGLLSEACTELAEAFERVGQVCQEPGSARVIDAADYWLGALREACAAPHLTLPALRRTLQRATLTITLALDTFHDKDWRLNAPQALQVSQAVGEGPADKLTPALRKDCDTEALQGVLLQHPPAPRRVDSLLYTRPGCLGGLLGALLLCWKALRAVPSSVQRLGSGGHEVAVSGPEEQAAPVAPVGQEDPVPRVVQGAGSRRLALGAAVLCLAYAALRGYRGYANRQTQALQGTLQPPAQAAAAQPAKTSDAVRQDTLQHAIPEAAGAAGQPPVQPAGSSQPLQGDRAWQDAQVRKVGSLLLAVTLVAGACLWPYQPASAATVSAPPRVAYQEHLSPGAPAGPSGWPVP